MYLKYIKAANFGKQMWMLLYKLHNGLNFNHISLNSRLDAKDPTLLPRTSSENSMSLQLDVHEKEK